MTNRFKSSQMCGIIENIDYPDNSIQAQAIFNRNVDIKGNLNLGVQTSVVDASGNTIYTNTGGQVNFDIDGTPYSILPSDLTQLKNILASETYVDTAISNIPPPDLTGYATETYVDTAISNVNFDLTGYATETYVDTAISNVNVDLTGYATETYVDNAISNVNVDLTGYATETYVDTAISNVNVDLTGYATETYVNSQVGTKTSLAEIQGNNNSWTGTNSFNSSLPTSTLTPSTSSQLTTKAYVDSVVGSSVGGIDLTLYAPKLNPTFSNDITVSNTANINQLNLSTSLGVNTQTVSATQLSYLSNLTGDINSRFNANESTISSHTSSINTINSTLPNKADDNTVVKLTGNQSIDGVKTFTSSPVIPDILLTDTNLQKAVNKKFVEDKIAQLVGGSPESLNSLNELASALGNDANFSTTVSNALGLKAPINSPSFTGIPTAPTATQGTNTTQIATTAYVDSGLSGKANKVNESFTGTCNFENIVISGNGSIQGQLSGTGNSIIGDNSVDTLTVNATSSFNAPITVSTGNSISTPAMSLNGTDLQTSLNSKTSLSAVQSNNNTWTGTNIFNTNIPTSSLTPSTNNDLTNKAYVDSQIATRTTLSAVQSNNNTWTGTNIFNTNIPTSTITPSTNNDLTNKAYVDSQVSTRTTLSAVQSNANTFSAVNTFTNEIDCRTIDTPNGALQHNLWESVTTGNTFLLNNTSLTGNVTIANRGSGQVTIRDNGSGNVNIATNNTGSTSVVNIGRNDGGNTVNIGTFSFSGNNLTLPSSFTTPSSTQIGYQVSSSASGVTLTSSTFVSGGLCSLTLSAGVWICNAYAHYYKGANTTTTTTMIFETINAISTNPTSSNGNAYIRNNYGNSITSGFSLPTGNAQRQVNQLTRMLTLTTSTTIYLTCRAIFSLAAGDTLAVDGLFNATRIA